MVNGRVSIIVPSRNERFLVPTVSDLIAKSTGDVEIIVVLDGYWEHGLPADPRVRILHRGQALGMRPGINAAARMATGEFLAKCDAHCLFADGWDETLKKHHFEANWVQVPRRYALDPINWTRKTGDTKYPIDYHYLSYPYERVGDVTCGLHGTPWKERRNERQHLLLDEEMSSQGSCWFMRKDFWESTIGELDIANYGNFVNEFQEVGCKAWLSGGSVMVNKHTWYAHLYKGREFGRGYILGPNGHKDGVQFCTDVWMHDRWPGAVRSLRWLVERFAPVPTWPADLDQAFARRAA